MYHRLSTHEIQDLHKLYANDRLFQNLYSAIAAPCSEKDDITPEEIWQLACEYVKQIVQTDNDLFEIDALPNKLHFLLSKYQIGEEVISRSSEDIQRTIFFVELVILYQLMRYQKELENHPYQKYCLAILSHIQDYPLMTKIIPVIKATNDRYEAIYGSELDTHDYLPFVVKVDSLLKEALKLTIACQSYLSHGYDITWIENFWSALFHSSLGDTLKQDLQGQNRYTTIYGIIGTLLQVDVFHGTQTDLADTTPLENPSKDSIRRYIGNGMRDNATNYAKFVIRYVNVNKTK